MNASNSPILTSTTATADASSVDGNTARIRRLVGVRTIAAAIIVTLAATVGLVGQGAGTASAYADTTRTGLIGTVVAPAATVQPGMSFYVPGVTVYRNGAVPYSSTQRVDVTYYLQYYSNGNWVLANQFTQSWNDPERALGDLLADCRSSPTTSKG